MTRWEGTVVCTTDRLVLRTFRLDDLPHYAALNAHPEVVRYLGGEPIAREDSDEIAAWANDVYERERMGLLAVERRTDGRFLGMCGLHHQSSMPDDVEVAWRLAPEHWGNGYATEAATAWLDYGFDTLGLPEIISMTDTDNDRSLAVMRRLGMRFDRREQIEDEGVSFDALIHVMDTAEWRTSRGV
jgi:RimJ/RimL family protein N-acetyltransferase